MTSTMPDRLRNEAGASDELNPSDSHIIVMREAADLIEKLEAENTVFRQFCANLNNIHRHRFAEAVDRATDELFKECNWPRAALRSAQKEAS